MKILSKRVVFTVEDELPSSFESDTGNRRFQKRIEFPEPFENCPVVQVSLAHIDIINQFNSRIGVAAESADHNGFELVFETWADTSIRGIGVVWIAYGAE